LAKIAVVLFLARYKSLSDLDDRAFFSCFSLAIYDLLGTRKEQNQYSNIQEKYGRTLIEKLEQISKETTQVNRHENPHLTKKLLKECLAGKYQILCLDLIPFLQVFIWDYQKQYLNTPKH
jgi:hypothetical protein